MKNIKKFTGARRLLAVILLLIAADHVSAQPFSYVYIQGDKKTPFYVKLDGEMQPRYGKNYAILSRLAPGPAHIQILFQQNVFPPQDFHIEIPVGGFRSFMLSKQGDDFTLYDATQKFYLTAGNDISADRLPPVKPVAVPAVVRAEPPASERVVQTPAAPPAGTSDPNFISGIELPPAGGTGSATTVPGGANTIQPFAPDAGVLKNSDCPQALQPGDFAKVYDAVLRRKGDEERLEAALVKLDNCFETWQARSINLLLESDAARYSLLKAIYPRITDQHLFPLLDDLLTDPVWKKEFVRLTGK